MAPLVHQTCLLCCLLAADVACGNVVGFHISQPLSTTSSALRKFASHPVCGQQKSVTVEFNCNCRIQLCSDCENEMASCFSRVPVMRLPTTDRAVLARVAAPAQQTRSSASPTVSMVSLGCPKNTVDGVQPPMSSNVLFPDLVEAAAWHL